MKINNAQINQCFKLIPCVTILLLFSHCGSNSPAEKTAQIHSDNVEYIPAPELKSQLAIKSAEVQFFVGQTITINYNDLYQQTPKYIGNALTIINSKKGIITGPPCYIFSETPKKNTEIEVFIGLPVKQNQDFLPNNKLNIKALKTAEISIKVENANTIQAHQYIQQLLNNNKLKYSNSFLEKYNFTRDNTMNTHMDQVTIMYFLE